MPPDPSGSLSKWAYGGWGLALSADGKSLYGISHDWQRFVSKTTIPAPVNSKDWKLLNVATTLIPWTNIVAGTTPTVDRNNQPYKLADIAVLDGKIHAVNQIYYLPNPDDKTNSTANLDLTGPAGKYQIGGFHGSHTSEFIFTLPKSWSDKYLPGFRLAQGRMRIPGGSFGPSLVASKGTEGKALIQYSNGDHDPDSNHYFRKSDFHKGDVIQGATWIETSDGRQAYVIALKKLIGPENYGTTTGKCAPSKGYYPVNDTCTITLALFDVNEIGQIAQGTRKPYDIQPYAWIDLKDIAWNGMYAYPGGIDYNPVTGQLLVFERQGDKSNPYEARPLAHAFKVN